jgi:hypothetical protein
VLSWEAEGELFNETEKKVEIEYIEGALNLIVPKNRKYNEEFDESRYYQ